MNLKHLTILLIFLLTLSLFLNYAVSTKAETTQSTPLYVGVDVAFENLTLTEQLIDNVSSYTNFFIIGCTGNYNQTRLTTISQYVYDKGLTFIVYSDNPRYPSQQWLQEAQSSWSDRFQGIYFFDEPGGKQLDQADYPPVNASLVSQTVYDSHNYSYVANQYVSTINWLLRSGPFSITKSFGDSNYKLFTSDYSLYWYDYQAGYDTVFAEFTMNCSRQLNIDLCRGAAAVQNRDWGIMITWNRTPLQISNSGPEAGPDLYNDMVLAYQNGAKYIIVFDSNLNFTDNVLQQGQLDAMAKFWQYAQAHPRTASPVGERSVYVLPQDYAYGFRSPSEDRIWGVWGSDSLTLEVSVSMGALFKIFGDNLDIVYPDSALNTIGYKNVIYWNDSRLIADLPSTSNSTQDISTDQPTSLTHPQLDISLVFYAITATIIIAVVVGTAVLRVKIKRQ